jgi:hypothetical protein
MNLRVAAAAFVVLAALATAGTAAPSSPDNLKVTADRTSISTALGRKFVFRTTISNRGSSAASGLIAHLNVLSLRNGVYVDPEDWSSNRTRYLAPIPAGRSLTLSWKLQAVNSGSIGVYVAVLPASGSARPPTTSPTVHVSIAHRQTLNSGGILPLALGIPAFLGALAGAVRIRRGRRPAQAGESGSTPAR